MAVEPEPPRRGTPASIAPVVTRPRPGHADLAGVVKYGHDDIRNVLERASARETAARVAVGRRRTQLLAQVGAASSAMCFASGRRRSPIRWRSASTRPRAIPRRFAAALRRPGGRAAMIAEIDRRARGGRHHGRRLRGHRARRAAGPRQPRAVGSQARRPARAGADVDPGHQGRRHRPRARRGGAAGLAHPRRDPSAVGRRPPQPDGRRAADQQRGRARRRHHQRRRPARHGLHEADRHADEAAAFGRSRPRWRSARRPSSAATSAPSPPRRSSAKRWSRSCWPMRSLEKFGGDSVEELVENWRASQARTAARFASTAGA